MKKSVSITDFMDAFTKMRPSNFTYEGLECLYNYLMIMNKTQDRNRVRCNCIVLRLF